MRVFSESGAGHADAQPRVAVPLKSPRATHKERERALGYKAKITSLAGLRFGLAL